MTTTFDALGVSTELVDALATQGLTEPFAIQTLTIADALAGRDVLGKAKTGSGKTLAFGLPLLDRITKAEPRHPHGPRPRADPRARQPGARRARLRSAG